MDAVKSRGVFGGSRVRRPAHPGRGGKESRPSPRPSPRGGVEGKKRLPGPICRSREIGFHVAGGQAQQNVTSAEKDRAALQEAAAPERGDFADMLTEFVGRTPVGIRRTEHGRTPN